MSTRPGETIKFGVASSGSKAQRWESCYIKRYLFIMTCQAVRRVAKCLPQSMMLSADTQLDLPITNVRTHDCCDVCPHMHVGFRWALRGSIPGRAMSQV